jgi:hypothetical protein
MNRGLELEGVVRESSGEVLCGQARRDTDSRSNGCKYVWLSPRALQVGNKRSRQRHEAFAIRTTTDSLSI